MCCTLIVLLDTARNLTSIDDNIGMQAYDKFRITLTEIKNDFKRQLEMECATMLTA